MHKVIAALLPLPFVAAFPLLAGPNEDLVAAETILKGIEIAAESSQAASDRANAAFVAIMSRKPESPAMSPFTSIDDCKDEFLSEVPDRFRLNCQFARNRGEDSEYYETDEQLAAAGCVTRAEAKAANCGTFTPGGCQETIPESAWEIPNDSLVACMTVSPRAEHLYDRLYKLFLDEEVERRIDALNPDERDVIRTQIKSIDA